MAEKQNLNSKKCWAFIFFVKKKHKFGNDYFL